VFTAAKKEENESVIQYRQLVGTYKQGLNSRKKASIRVGIAGRKLQGQVINRKGISATASSLRLLSHRMK